jgi:hypothetical protein
VKKLSTDQIDLIAEIDGAIPRLDKWIVQARKTHLLILERELMYLQKGLREAVDMQTRAFRDDSLVDPEPLFPEGRFPYGKREQQQHWCATCGGFRNYTHECTNSSGKTLPNPSRLSGKDRSTGERDL